MNIEELLVETFKTPEEAIKKHGTDRIVCRKYPPLSLVVECDIFGKPIRLIPPTIPDYFEFTFTLQPHFTETGEICWRYVQD